MIVPCFNGADQLAGCLRALAVQSHPRDAYEVVVVDNGSEEDLRSTVARFPGFRLEHEPQVGAYAARNKGIGASKGEILAFTDADCVPEVGWIQAGVEALEASAGLGAVGGRIVMFARDAQRLTAFDVHDLVWGMPQRLYIERFGLAATGNLFVRRDAFHKAGPFDPAYRSCGDCEWSFRMTASGLELGYAPDARVSHPTRSTLASFVRRRRRIAGGYHLLDQTIACLYPESGFVVPRSLSGSIEKIRRAGGHRLLDTRRRRAQFACVELLLWAVTALESLRIRLGGEPIRG